jgi:hypothetical protein
MARRRKRTQHEPSKFFRKVSLLHIDSPLTSNECNQMWKLLLVCNQTPTITSLKLLQWAASATALWGQHWGAKILSVTPQKHKSIIEEIISTAIEKSYIEFGDPTILKTHSSSQLLSANLLPFATKVAERGDLDTLKELIASFPQDFANDFPFAAAIRSGSQPMIGNPSQISTFRFCHKKRKPVQSYVRYYTLPLRILSSNS